MPLISEIHNPVKSFQPLLPLAPGAIAPLGWLRDWANTAIDGITGHLDEYSATFRHSWNGHAFEARGANADGTGWPLEQCAYWLDGAIRLAFAMGDEVLIQKVSERLDRVVDGVLNGGETFIYWMPKSALEVDVFNNWAHSHIGRALVAYYQATGNERILRALTKVYRDFPIGALPATFGEVSGAVNVDPMLDTYEMSGDPAILENVLAFSRTKSYCDTAARWAAGDFEVGHNVIFYENIRVPVMLSPWTEAPEDSAATNEAIAWSDRHSGLPLGLTSGEEWHAGIGATRNVETCDVAASLWTFLRLMRLTGEGSLGDRIERIFLNAGSGPVSHDFKSMSYYQCPNRYSEDLPGEEPRWPGAGSYAYTEIGHEVLCCVGNLNRVIPFYITHMWMATADGGLAAALYGPSRVRAAVNGGVLVEIESATSYPFNEAISLTINSADNVVFPLHLRIPEWCNSPSISVNGSPIEVAANDLGFAVVTRLWTAGDVVTIELPMSARISYGRETPFPQLDYYRPGRQIVEVTEIDSPFACCHYGPLLCALSLDEDVEGAESLVDGSFYALAGSAGDSPDLGARVTRLPYEGRWTWGSSLLRLNVPAVLFTWRPTEVEPLPKRAISDGTPVEIRLLPYGSTKHRISMFPVAAAKNPLEKLF